MGLFNEAIGIVVYIYFEENQNPNTGNLPKYVIVEFPNYTGPAWSKTNPKVVPIPLVTYPCAHHCCTVTFCPLTLAFVRIGHAFQRQEVEPDDEDSSKPKKVDSSMIACPGNLLFEASNPGRAYKTIARSSTEGTIGKYDCNLFHWDKNTY
jgi:hypothetical protein